MKQAQQLKQNETGVFSRLAGKEAPIQISSDTKGGRSKVLEQPP